MAKAKRGYVCQECGAASPKWLGRCPRCGAWESMAETELQPRRNAAPAGMELIRLAEAQAQEGRRIQTGIGELDRVLGGGLTLGSAVLIAGDPGIGKSTLLLQAASCLGVMGQRFVYVSAEESLAQLGLRARRLGLSLAGIEAAAETDLETIEAWAASHPWDVLALDSIQAVTSGQAGPAPGGLAQVRAAAGRLIRLAKTSQRPVIMVGHVTKEGTIAGPKVLEHMVDTVLYFEGERTHNLRILRAFKNRFGSVNEIGVFEMKEGGLSQVANPSELFLAERPQAAPGSVVCPTMEGSRPILVELQALAAPSALAMPRRACLGLDAARVNLIAAVLERRAGLDLGGSDIYVNAAGGVKVGEPAADLALAAAIISSLGENPVDYQAVFMGEIGLAGEVRGVARLEARLAEAAKLGFARAYLPAGDLARAPGTPLELLPVRSVADLAVLLA